MGGEDNGFARLLRIGRYDLADKNHVAVTLFQLFVYFREGRIFAIGNTVFPEVAGLQVRRRDFQRSSSLGRQEVWISFSIASAARKFPHGYRISLQRRRAHGGLPVSEMKQTDLHSRVGVQA